MKIIYVNCGVKHYIDEDHRSYLRNFLQWWKESLKKEQQQQQKIQACTGFAPLTSAIPVQRSTKPAGSRFVINPWKDGDKVMNIWNSYNYVNCRVKNSPVSN